MKNSICQETKIETSLGITTRHVTTVAFISASSCLQKHHIEHRFRDFVRFGSSHCRVFGRCRKTRCFWVKCSWVEFSERDEMEGTHFVHKWLCLGNVENVAREHLRLVGTAQSTSSGEVEEKKQSQFSQTTKISFDTVLQELSSIQKDGPSNIAILGTRHCSLLHQQIVELLTYANVLIGNHIYTSGGGGTNSAAIRGALRAEKPHLLTVILPQSRSKQPKEAQELLKHVTQVIEMPHNDNLPLDVSSRLCNSSIISKCQQLISFVFHDSDVLLEAVKETKSLKKLVTLLYLD
ncbi:uncharacterized protein Gasu_17530 [Galdieria sulphuraria]|uniref:Uncharacterized protein n=1 Tax=Galdieria sulphuraria TaxID=130081 RepID=M2W5D5_GALSU|nr:uncharacterized protein Gasu_17530 [Galdieria sulphuraria]EME30991.1 hypothetical protein Gasu_17530 [Galdieria sulphuraria]|eukprot:XP_005707511.1 hypothetical protein Gasu_17530 [Galdieria sulphuraria]